MKCPSHTLALRIPFHLIRCRCNTCTNQSPNNMIHLLFTVAFDHWRQILLKLHRHVVHRSKASNLPFTLATSPSRHVLSCLDLLHISHMTPCHVSYAMSSFITCVSLATNTNHLHLHGMCYSHKCSGGLITCVSHINTY